MLGRTAVVLGLACLVQVPAAHAQLTGFETFKWYVGAHGGVVIFETPSQTRGGIFAAGGDLLVTAKRTGLLISVEEGIETNQLSSFTDSAGATQQVVFNDLRKYTLALLAFPLRTIVQPYVGLGVGWLQTVKEYPQAGGSQSQAERAGSTGFGTLIGGVQARVSRFIVFGQYQLTSAAAANKLFIGPTHTLTAGMRFSLGNAREGVEGRGSGPD
jgi:hypothetical protein